ncbi:MULTISPECIES: hypothetical protein [unclassified Microbacterium]|uniref:hypothetical protein n=1 Tax=unclassified Microbacterium TaxID=2609290 RepID=UPI00386D06C6
MSDGNAFDGAGDSGSHSGKVETAKQEAAAVTDTAAGAAKDVAHTAKDEAASVIGEARSQVRDLYSQSRDELSTQAAQQQQRIAGGMKAVGDELGSMASSSENGGIATDLVQQISRRVSDAASWLEDRDPAAVLEEVKRFARRRPVVFIAGAAIAGIVAGRLVRAMASSQHEQSGAASGGTPSGVTAGSGAAGGAPRTPVVAPATAVPDVTNVTPAAATSPVPTADVDEAPLYTESAAAFTDSREGGFDERRDTV